MPLGYDLVQPGSRAHAHLHVKNFCALCSLSSCIAFVEKQQSPLTITSAGSSTPKGLRAQLTLERSDGVSFETSPVLPRCVPVVYDVELHPAYTMAQRPRMLMALSLRADETFASVRWPGPPRVASTESPEQRRSESRRMR